MPAFVGEAEYPTIAGVILPDGQVVSHEEALALSTPDWPDWVSVPSATAAAASRVASASTLNERQRPIEDLLRTVSADTRKLGPLYGPTTIGGRVDIVQQIGTYIYIRALFCVGEVNQISSVEINGASYLTGDPTADPDYMGDWEDSAVWTALGGFPYAASSGEIWLYGGAYYETNQAFSVASNTGSYNPEGAYSAYFDQLITNASVNTYTGTTTQTADALLSGAGGALTGYAETLTGTWCGQAYGIAYAAIRLLASEYTGGFPRVTASINGLKVYDPRTTTTAYSTNPALALADFIVSPLYGLGATVDWTSVDTAADYCDVAFADGARIQIGMAIAPDRPEPTVDWLDVLRAYALCWLDVRDGVYTLIVDGPATSSGTIKFDQGTGTDPELSDVASLAAVPLVDRPNRVRVFYTSGQQTEYVEAETAGVTAGTDAPREMELRMPGLFSEQMAQRYANYRLALATTEIWRVSFGLFDAGIRVSPGDVWTLTSPNGITAKDVRVITRQSSQLGDYAVTASVYDASVYASP